MRDSAAAIGPGKRAGPEPGCTKAGPHTNGKGATMGTCDKCGATAYVTTTIDTGLPLSWCAHHYAEHEAALSPYVIAEDDQRHLLEVR